MDGIGDMVLFRGSLDHYADTLGVEQDDITVLGCDSWAPITSQVFAGYRVIPINERRYAKRLLYRLKVSTLVQCTLIAIRYSGYLNAFYRRVKERRGSGKAIIATTRKLLKIIYDTLKNGWVFEDFTTYTLAQKPLSAGQSS